MSKVLGEINSVKLECEECAAEIIILTLYKPGFRDLSPLCPYCQFPMTSQPDPDITMANLTTALKAMQAQIKEMAA